VTKIEREKKKKKKKEIAKNRLSRSRAHLRFSFLKPNRSNRTVYVALVINADLAQRFNIEGRIPQRQLRERYVRFYRSRNFVSYFSAKRRGNE